MPSDANHRYDPVPPIPSYDEAVAAGSSRAAFDAGGSARRGSSDDAFDGPGMESRSLLRTTHQRSSSTATDPDGISTGSPVRSRRNHNGYRAPTVETDDEDSLWGADSLDGAAAELDEEAAHVRREMQELDMDDGHSGRSRSSLFGKHIGRFSLSLPQWRWKWRWHLPRLRIQLPNANASTAGGGSGQSAPAAGDGSPDQSQDEDSARQRRWRWPAFSTSALCLLVARLVAVFLVLGFLYLIFMSDMFSNMTRRMFDPEAVRQHLQSHVDSRQMRDSMKHFTSYAHLAGSEGDYAFAVDVRNMFRQYGLEDVSVEEFWTYINYPKAGGRAVEVLGDDGKALWAAKIEEEEGGTESAGRQTFVFHAHSKAGDVRGPLIYANYGTREDFQKLHDMGIDTKGAIAMVRYYGPQEDAGLKVKAAELAGFVGCIIYSDPADDGFRTGEPAPDGRVMPEDGAQRASVSLPSRVMGDPLTPGWLSSKENPVLDPARSKGLVQIPSIPLAWRDANELLPRLRGHGKEVPAEWAGGLPGVEAWFTGDQSSPVVRLRNEQDEVTRKEIWNVYGALNGYEQAAKSIIIGNRRDALAFGAAGPHSGTAIFMEMARVFGDLRARGWQPLRTIQFMSWDGGAYNMAGSTEFVEKNTPGLVEGGFAYINLDEAVGGGGGTFRAAGNPVFRGILRRILHRVADPNRNDTNNLRDIWDRSGAVIEGLGAASDYVAFQDAVGVSSLDLRFGPSPGGDGAELDRPRPPRGSSYETFDWMERHGDPGFVYHQILGQIMALLIVELADRPVLPFDMEAMGEGIARWADEFAGWAEPLAAAAAASSPEARAFTVGPLKQAADEVKAAIARFAKWEVSWENSVLAYSGFESVVLGKQRAEYNERMALFDTHLVDMDINDGGVPNRTQFRHVVFGPKLWNSREAGYFPLVRDAVEAGDWPLAQRMLERTVRIIKDAASHLNSG